MKIVFLQNVKGQGKKDELKEVSDGYARNYLIPRKLAAEATPDVINAMKLKEKARQAQYAKDKEQAEKTAKELDGLVVKIPAKAGQGGKLFGSVTSKEISESLLSQHGISIDKQKIVQTDPIKTYGSFKIKCKLGFEINGTINVLVTEEK